MSPLVMFNHLLFVNASPARSLSQSAPETPRDLETENIQAPSQGLLVLPQLPGGGATFCCHPQTSKEPQHDVSQQEGHDPTGVRG